MARFNEILVGRFNRYLQKMMAMKGEAPSPQLGSEIMPMIQIPAGVEDRYLQSWERFMISLVQPAVAAQVSGVRLRNPVGSNVIAVVEGIWVSVGSAFLLEIGTTTDLGTLVLPVSLDTRQRQRSTLITSMAAPAAGIDSIFGTIFPDGSISMQLISNEGQQLPLLPGTGYQIRALTVNLQLAVVLMWRERYLEDSERT